MQEIEPPQSARQRRGLRSGPQLSQVVEPFVIHESKHAFHRLRGNVRARFTDQGGGAFVRGVVPVRGVDPALDGILLLG